MPLVCLQYGSNVMGYTRFAGHKPRRKIVLHLRPSNYSGTTIERWEPKWNRATSGTSSATGRQSQQSTTHSSTEQLASSCVPVQRDKGGFKPKIAIRKHNKNCCSSAVLVHKSHAFKWLVTCNFIKYLTKNTKETASVTTYQEADVVILVLLLLTAFYNSAHEINHNTEF